MQRLPIMCLSNLTYNKANLHYMGQRILSCYVVWKPQTSRFWQSVWIFTLSKPPLLKWGFFFLIHIHFKFKIFSLSEGQPGLSINMSDMQYRAIIVLCPLFQVSYIALKIAEKERKEKIDGALYRFGWVKQEEVNILPLQDRAQF